MSEISKAAETSQNKPSLLKRAGDLLSKPIGKFIGGAMIVGAVAGTTKEAVADTVACITLGGNGEGNYLVTDKIESPESDNNIIGPNNDEVTLQNELPLVFNDRILAHSYDYYSNPRNLYKEFDPKLDSKGLVSWPGNNINQIIGEENGIGISGGYFYHLNGNTFELMGTGAESQNPTNNQAFGGYVFVRSLTASTSPQKYIVDIFREADILDGGSDGDNSNRISPIKEWQIGEDADGGIISSGNGLAIDKFVGSILTGVNTVNGDGYIEVPFGGSLSVDGKTLNDINFAEDYPLIQNLDAKFRPTGFAISEIYTDSNGDRFFKSTDGKLYIENSREEEYSGEKYSLVGVGQIKGITVLPSGGLYIVEEGASIPMILKINDSDYTLSPSLDFPENGVLGSITGCNAIDPEYEPTDPIPEEVESSDEGVTPDVIEDTGTDTQYDVTPDVIEDTGTDTQYDVTPDVIEDTGTDAQYDVPTDAQDDISPDVITPDISTDESGRDTVQTDTTRPDTATTDNEGDGSTEPVDAIETDTTVEGGKGGGCSSVPGGVADTRGMVTLLLAGLAALGIKRRKAAVKSKE